MRSLVLVFVAATAIAPVRPASAQMETFDAALEAQVREWTTAVMTHRQGEPDQPAASIAAWPPATLTRTFAGAQCLARELQHLQGDGATNLSGKPAVFLCGHERTTAEVRRLLSLGDTAAAGEVDRLFARAALLHTDIALLKPAPRPETVDPASRSSVLIVEDGKGLGTLRTDTEFEWQCARALLAPIPPGGVDDFARRWYRTTIAYLQSHSQLGEVTPTIDAALKLFPNDPRILFYAGAMHEVFAGARTRSAVIAAVPPPGQEIAVKPATDELKVAEQFYARAIAAGNATPELRLHHGRVLDRLGRHDQAIRELTAVERSLESRDLRYDAALFLGQAHAALGQRAEAEAGFNRAHELFPKAQSPLLGLSQVARQANDLPAASAALDRALTLPPSPVDRDDPWWRYDSSHVHDADALLADLRKPFLQTVPR